MPTQWLYDKHRVQRGKSTMIMGMQIREHGAKYRVTGEHMKGYDPFCFGDFDTLSEAKEFMQALGRQIEAEGRR
jgi:hypothetical protein